jgi:hypothetical protein
LELKFKSYFVRHKCNNIHMNPTCPICLKEVSSTDTFCPNCGHKLPNKNAQLTGGQKIKIYSTSILLAPFGLYWFFKYFRSEDIEKRKVAYYVLVLTLIVLAVVIVINAVFIKEMVAYANLYNSILGTY